MTLPDPPHSRSLVVKYLGVSPKGTSTRPFPLESLQGPTPSGVFLRLDTPWDHPGNTGSGVRIPPTHRDSRVGRRGASPRGGEVVSTTRRGKKTRTLGLRVQRTPTLRGFGFGSPRWALRVGGGWGRNGPGTVGVSVQKGKDELWVPERHSPSLRALCLRSQTIYRPRSTRRLKRCARSSCNDT